MIKIMLSLMVLLMSYNLAFAGGLSQSFTWTQGASGYGTKIYIGTETGNLQYSYDAGTDTSMFTVTDLFCETTYYAAAAHYADVSGAGIQESALCPEVSFTTDACMSITTNPMPELPNPVITPVILFNKQ